MIDVNDEIIMGYNSTWEYIFGYENVERVTYIYLIPLVCLPGSVAAVLSAIVFARLRQNSLEILLCGLSLFDVVILLSSLFMFPAMHECSRIDQALQQSSMVCHFFWRSTVSLFPISLISQAGSIFTYVAVTVDRFIAVTFPLKKRVWATRNKSTTVLICITVVSTLFKLPSFFEVALNENGQSVTTTLRENKFYTEIYLLYLYFFLMQLIPWTIIIFLNAYIIHKVRLAYRVQEAMIHGKPKTKREDAERKVTVMAIVMTCIFIICNIPPGINNLVEEYGDRAYFRQRIPLSNLLVCFNSASNVMIYCVFNTRFRRAALQILGFSTKNPTRAGSVITKITKEDGVGMLRSRISTYETLNGVEPTAC
ncbi:unnamed protein product [Caenorhabditis angaria]|uniref:G-protein coupled receptors family 1 profile domain-containing protein n=1 Tax=Caenorhabditis angaria TaxID=860376 RepID=A0A9P1N419_9PELO|nr:unnamed protein product [Caenorhabditis angaria]